MEEADKKRGVVVGIFVFIGLVFLIGGILMIGNLHETFKTKIAIIALFDDVSGLQSGDNIRFSGVKIGTVSSLKFYAERKVKVEMKVEDNAQQYIRKDAFVKIGTDGLIGNKILIIYGGSSQYPQIEAGDTLGVEKTFTSEDMINTFQENNKNILAITNDFKVISQNMKNGQGSLGKLLSDNDLYAHLNSASVSIQNAAGKIQQLTSSFSTFTDGLNKKGTLANQLATDTSVFLSVQTSISNLQQISDSAKVLINNLKQASADQKTSLGVLLHDEESGANLKQTIKNLESGTEKLNQDLEALQHNFLFRGFFKKKK